MRLREKDDTLLRGARKRYGAGLNPYGESNLTKMRIGWRSAHKNLASLDHIDEVRANRAAGGCR